MKTNRDVKQGISVCSRIIRLTNNRTKSRTRAIIPRKEKKATTKNAVAMCEECLSDGLCLARLGVIGLKEAHKPGKNPQKVLDQFEKYGSLSQRYVKQVSRKRKDHRLKIQVKNHHQRRPYAMKLEDRSQEETERQQRCARSKAWNLVKTDTSSKKKTRLHSTFRGGMGTLGCVNKRAGGKRVCS